MATSSFSKGKSPAHRSAPHPQGTLVPAPSYPASDKVPLPPPPPYENVSSTPAATAFRANNPTRGTSSPSHVRTTCSAKFGSQECYNRKKAIESALSVPFSASGQLTVFDDKVAYANVLVGEQPPLFLSPDPPHADAPPGPATAHYPVPAPAASAVAYDSALVPHLPSRRRNHPLTADSPASSTTSPASVLRPWPFKYISVPPAHGPSQPVPRLAHGLERVLFNPGVHLLRDPRSGVYNFSPSLDKITQPDDFNYGALTPYVMASKDKDLFEVAIRENCKYVSSTSSITNLLAKMHMTLFMNQPLNLSDLSAVYQTQSTSFTTLSRKPTSAILHYKDGRYIIDQEKSKEESDAVILMSLGHSMEKMLTLEPEQFNKYLVGYDGPREEAADAYHYAVVENFLLRSQLDCHDDRLPRKSFDLKTRASLAIRMDPANFMAFTDGALQENSSYTLKRNRGLLESFEREYYDMARSAFLKYNFQARIGDMDGIFVCYHNTQNVFGFQYVPVEEMAEVLCGSPELGDGSFSLSVKVLQHVLDVVTAKHAGRSIRLTLGATKSHPELAVFAEAFDPSDKDNNATAPRGPLSYHKFEVASSLHQSEPTAANMRNWDVSLRTLVEDEAPAVAAGSEAPAKLWTAYANMRRQCPNLNVRRSNAGRSFLQGIVGSVPTGSEVLGF
ncbi:hypothetical protein HK405_003520 [Cladochytrium tenue]|nr:hypothetical protein HK405_003520 [Cladochytrium tenue]